jgi:hypothetical protein
VDVVVARQPAWARIDRWLQRVRASETGAREQNCRGETTAEKCVRAAASSRTRPVGLAHTRLPFERVLGAESVDFLEAW